MPRSGTRSPATQPFVRHEFLSALIDTGCASARSGWRPQFLLVRRAGALVAAMPLFAKSHSYGEYVFDWAWADAHERHGIEYYPKLLSAIPFTPVRGPRLLGKDKEVLVEAALDLARDTSSLHVLFPAEDELPALLETRHDAAPHGAVPLAQRRLRRLRGFPAAHEARAAQEHPAGAPAGARRRRFALVGGGNGDPAPALGVLQPLLSPHLRRAPLEPVPQPGFLPAHRRGIAATTSPW